MCVTVSTRQLCVCVQKNDLILYLFCFIHVWFLFVSLYSSCNRSRVNTRHIRMYTQRPLNAWQWRTFFPFHLHQIMLLEKQFDLGLFWFMQSVIIENQEKNTHTHEPIQFICTLSRNAVFESYLHLCCTCFQFLSHRMRVVDFFFFSSNVLRFFNRFYMYILMYLYNQ